MRTPTRAILAIAALTSMLCISAGKTDQANVTTRGGALATNRSIPRAHQIARERVPFNVLPLKTHIARLLASGGGFYWPQHVGVVKQKQRGSRRAMFFCRKPPVKLVQEAALWADEMGVYGFSDWSVNKAKPGCRIWPSYDNPLINHLRDLRMASIGVPTYAIVPFSANVGVIAGIPDGRKVVFEEQQWMVLAAVGANFQGVLWAADQKPPKHAKRLTRLEESLLEHARDIERAVPVGWAKCKKSQPLSALASDKKLFVVLLNQAYMMPADDGKSIALPLEDPRCQGEVVVTPPSGVSVKSCTSLHGRAIPVSQSGRDFSAAYSFTGGGEILIFDLSAKAAAPPAASQRRNTAVTTRNSRTAGTNSRSERAR